MFEVAYIFPFFIALFGVNYIGAVPCFFLFLPHVIGGNTAPTFMFYVGLERLCCLVFPIWTKQMSASSSKVLLFVGLIISNTFWFYYAVILYQATVNEMWNMEVRCSMGDIMPDRIRALFFRNGLAILGATTTLYSILCIAVLIRAMWSKTQITTYNWHILKAVSVIMALLLTGWVLNASSIYYLPPFNLNAVQRLVASSILNDWTLLCSGSNGLVLYMFSVDYRRAFKKELKCFFSDQSPSNSSNNMGFIPPPVSRINPHRRMIQIQSPNL